MTPPLEIEGEKPRNGHVATVTVSGLASLIVAFGTVAGYQVFQPPRPDPFTGSDGKRLEERLQSQIDLLDRDGTRALSAMESRVSSMERVYGGLSVKLDNITTQLTDMRVILGRIEERETILRGKP